MNEDIIRMAREAGLERDGDNFFSKNYEEMDVHIDDLKRFAELVHADERKACAEIAAWILKMPQNDVSHHILARGNK